MRFYEASSLISATPASVWATLIDGSAWPTWDSGVIGVEGQIARGATLKIRSEAAPGRTFPVRVTEFVPDRRLEFTGGMPLGLFRGVRTYDLTPGDDGRTAIRVREEYTGPMLGLIWRSMPDLGASFETFVVGLKKRVESGAAT